MLKLVTFDPLRTLHLPGVSVIKPAHFFKCIDRIRAADWILFPEYWQVNRLLGSNSLNLNREKIGRAIMQTRMAETDINGPDTPHALTPVLPGAA